MHSYYNKLFPNHFDDFFYSTQLYSFLFHKTTHLLNNAILVVTLKQSWRNIT